MRDDTNNLFPKGKLTFFRLISNNICYGPMPKPGDIVEQHLSIRADGRVWLSFYQFATGTKFIFCFDGAYKSDRIESIKVDYIRVTKIRSGVIPDGAAWGFVTCDYNEHLYIDRKAETIEHFQKIGEECDITRTYHIGEGVSDFLDDYDIDSFLTEIEGNPDDVIDDPMNVTTYNVEIRYKYAEPRNISGSYDKKALPTDWPDFMDDVWKFMRFYGMGEIMDFNIYGKAKRRSSDYMFVFVTFEEYGQEYSYLCDDDEVSEEDWVLVPVGNDGKTTIVPVSKIEYHPADEAPYPIEKIKRIIRVVDEKEFDPSTSEDNENEV